MSNSATPPAPETASFLAHLRDAVRDNSFVKLTLSRPRAAAPDLRQLRVRPIELRGQPMLSLVWRHDSRDLTENLPHPAALDRIASQLGNPFHSATLLTRDADLQLDFSRRGRPMLRQSPPSHPAPPVTTHDRPKNHLLDPHTPWLAALGITDPSGRVRATMADKWRQINRFAEILDTALPSDPPTPFHLVDFGCGRGLLTFAAHEVLSRRLGTQIHVTGVELRPHLVEAATTAARACGLDTLHFHAGDIRDFPDAPLHAMIALHACDTATDFALHLGIRRRASLLIAAPCCHKELRPQLRIPEPLAPLLRHGIHLGQEADMLTDSLRVLLLESQGYDTSLFEFISTEHTAKNKMILAKKRGDTPNPEALAAYHRLKDFYGIQHQELERLLDPAHL